MRKLLILALSVLVLGGCTSGSFFTPISSINSKAVPSQVTENSDGSTTFEFKFTLEPFDARKALQRIDEFLAGYANEKKFTGYEVEKVNGKTIAGSNDGGSSWVAPASASFAMSQSDKTTINGKDQYGRILVMARFRTQQ